MAEHWIEMRDGTNVYSCSAVPAGKPVGHIHLLHGLAEHIGRYREFTDFLAGKGFVVTGHDHRGHGKTGRQTGRKLGFFGDGIAFDDLVDDAFEVIQYYRNEHSDLPFLLFGHSMGSFLARRYIQLYGRTVSKVILSGTGSSSAASVYLGKQLAERNGKKNGWDAEDPTLNAFVFGRFAKTIPQAKTKLDWLTRNEQSIEDYARDESCGFIPSSGLFRELFRGMALIDMPQMLANVPKSLPILLVSGGEDPVGNRGKGVWTAAKKLTDAGLQNVRVQLYENARHELIHELNKDVIFKQLYEWMVVE